MSLADGGIALLSQSGAITASFIDCAADEVIGFSHVVSLGDMADVDAGDYLDLLAGDAKTRAILLYLASIHTPPQGMSAARAAARLTPVIAIKADRRARRHCPPFVEADKEAAEFGLLVRTDLQGRRLGWELLRHVIDCAKAEGLSRIRGLVLTANTKMLTMCREFGFETALQIHEPSVATVAPSL
jgi:succinyl-CoA synthetase alpha subunit